jgi:hypothetical protein
MVIYYLCRQFLGVPTVKRAEIIPLQPDAGHAAVGKVCKYA